MNVELIKQNIDKYKKDFPKITPMFVCNPSVKITEDIGCEIKLSGFMPDDKYIIMDSDTEKLFIEPLHLNY